MEQLVANVHGIICFHISIISNIFMGARGGVVVNTFRTGAFKLFKCTFPGSKQFKSTFIICFFKYL